MELNEAEKRSKENREEDIELKAQLCENSMQQNEAETKSEEKSGDREEDIELK